MQVQSWQEQTQSHHSFFCPGIWACMFFGVSTKVPRVGGVAQLKLCLCTSGGRVHFWYSGMKWRLHFPRSNKHEHKLEFSWLYLRTYQILHTNNVFILLQPLLHMRCRHLIFLMHLIHWLDGPAHVPLALFLRLCSVSVEKSSQLNCGSSFPQWRRKQTHQSSPLQPWFFIFRVTLFSKQKNGSNNVFGSQVLVFSEPHL